jgi:hypothetical protein
LLLLEKLIVTEAPDEDGSGPEHPYDEAPEYPPTLCVAGGGADVCVGVGDALCVVGVLTGVDGGGV